MGEVVLNWRMLDPVQRFLMRPDQVGPFSQWHGGHPFMDSYIMHKVCNQHQLTVQRCTIHATPRCFCRRQSNIYVSSFFGKGLPITLWRIISFKLEDCATRLTVWPYDRPTPRARHKRQVCQQLFVAIGATTRVEGNHDVPSGTCDETSSREIL